MTATKTAKKLSKAMDQVDEILEHFPKARNNDFYGFWMWAKYRLDLPMPYISSELLEELNGKTETFRRCRQKIQNEKKRWPPVVETKLARVEKSAEMREAVHYV